MKQIFSKEAFQILPCQNGFIFVVKEERDEKAVVSYKMLDFERMTLSPITRNVYLLSKFGNHFEQFDYNPEDFLQYRTLFLPDHRLLVVDVKGDAKVYGSDGGIIWRGSLLYEDCPPDSLVAGEDGFYASYTAPGTIVRYSAKNLRPELRFGGGKGKLPAPSGLFYQHGRVLFCAPEEHKIFQLDTEAFEVEEYHAFEEPVHRYLKYNANEIVLLDSGIYKL